MMNTSCTLEHCHTNLFALQSLSDMKWKCFRRSTDYHSEVNQLGRIDNYKDPVLVAYWNAMRDDRLCAWRRVLTADGQKTERELWLFGINEDLSSDLPNLRPVHESHGSWNDNPMSYDCRTMLFKALHNMIEKHLLSKGFARLKDWFVLPVNDHSDVKVPNFSFNFNFFLHGDNKVCACVDVQRHKHIFHLTINDFDQTTPSNVILSPYGINAILIGPASKEVDVNNLRDNWERNYPLQYIDGLPEFVEVRTGNVRMFYPTCFVYKIGVDENVPTSKKSDRPGAKESKASRTVNKTIDLTSNTNKIDNVLAKKFANNLLISAQRNICIDHDKKKDDLCSFVNDPVNHSSCQCNLFSTINTRFASSSSSSSSSSSFVPFHLRSRVPSTLVSDTSNREKVESSKTENSSEVIESHETLIETNSSPTITPHTQSTANEKFNDWISSTSTSTPIANSSPLPTPMTNSNITILNSPTSNPITTRGIKRSNTMAFNEIIDDVEPERKQSYDFNTTDAFLISYRKRIRNDSNRDHSLSLSAITPAAEHVYNHGQPTPPSPSLFSPAINFDVDDNCEVTSYGTGQAFLSTMSRHNSLSFNTTEGPSMADLDVILDQRDSVINTETSVQSQSSYEHATKSSSRKESMISVPPPPPPPPMPTVLVNNTNMFHINKSLNGALHDVEPIYNTPPGSSSSDKLQMTHSPYNIIVEASTHVATAFDTLIQFSQESILAPFELNNISEHSVYCPINKMKSQTSVKRYEPSEDLPKKNSPVNFKRHPHMTCSVRANDLLSSPSYNQLSLRQQTTPRSIATPTLHSPFRSNDLQSSPYPNRSIGSVQTINSPSINFAPSFVEVDSCMFNVLLNDSILNFYRDINFDSCVLCPCTQNYLSIQGNDGILYLEKTRDNQKTMNSQNYLHHNSTAYHQPQSIHNTCSCGFSAVVNLRLSYSSGLFYEDEVDITGVKSDAKYRQLNENLTVNLLELIERKESVPSPFDYVTYKSRSRKLSQSISQLSKNPFYLYENRSCLLAMDQARNNNNIPIDDDVEKHHWIHQWSYSTTPLESDQQLITMLRSLQPLLIDALKKRNVNGLWSTIDGPLTWKSFYQLLYVQNQHAQLEEQISGPQPIPYLLAGIDREWVTLAPYGLKFWDKLCLEPYSKGKDVDYICVVPDNSYISTMTKIYLHELSANYELCRLGSHRPLIKQFPDQGLLHISKQNIDMSKLPNVDQWFTENENKHLLGSRLKFYAQALKEKLANILSIQFFDSSASNDAGSLRDSSRITNDISSSDNHSTNTDPTNNSYAFGSSTNLGSNNIYTSGSVTTDSLSAQTISNLSPLNNANNNENIDSNDLKPYESYYHGRTLNDDQFFLVIYLIDTFRYELTGLIKSENDNANIDESIDIYIKKAFYRIYMDLIKDLPEKITARIHIQIVPFESIINQQIESDSEFRSLQYKRLSFHVYDQLRRTVSYTTRAKSLTGFGPAASEEKNPAKIVMRLYTPSYILSSRWDFRFKSFSDINEQANDNGSVLFCSYCLSEDQRYLLATCCDDRGELMEICSINIEVPDRHRRKTQCARKIGLQKLWNFILRIVGSTSMPWRIVVGRLGRLSHGELKNWGVILSKKNLVRCATTVREMCSMCRFLRSHDHPVILSACLISMETHPLLTILPESFELGEMRGTQPSNNNTTTMQMSGQVLNDVSVTHILTLPTSAIVQHVQSITRSTDPRQFAADNDDDIFSSLFGMGMLDPENFDNMPSPTTDLDFPSGLDINHVGHTSGQLSRASSLSVSQNNFNSNDPCGNQLNNPNVKTNSSMDSITEVDLNDIPLLHHQPLAVGFYVSTIGTLNPLPIWMLQGKSEQRLNNSSSVFKATLHVNIPNVQHSDDILLAQSHDQRSIHPLDSNYTYVVLRHVLESYNRLSWLLIDGKTNERASCLPVHIETLLKLYDAFLKFV